MNSLTSSLQGTSLSPSTHYFTTGSAPASLYLCPELDSLHRFTHTWVLILASPDKSSCTFYTVHKRQIGSGSRYYTGSVLRDVDLYTTAPVSTNRGVLFRISEHFDKGRHDEVIEIAERALTDCMSEVQSWGGTFLEMLLQRGIVGERVVREYVMTFENNQGLGDEEQKDRKLEDLMGDMGLERKGEEMDVDLVGF